MKLQNLSIQEKDDFNLLRCPNCAGTNLHHGRVIIRNLEKEDDSGIEVTVRSTLSETRYLPAGANGFFGRRDAIAIFFSCETCHAGCDLLIKQHKGETQLKWL